MSLSALFTRCEWSDGLHLSWLDKYHQQTHCDGQHVLAANAAAAAAKQPLSKSRHDDLLLVDRTLQIVLKSAAHISHV